MDSECQDCLAQPVAPWSILLDILAKASWWVWILFILLKTENNKKIIFDYCSLKKTLFICLMHCSCLMNSAPGAGPKKKKNKGWNTDVIQTLI